MPDSSQAKDATQRGSIIYNYYARVVPLLEYIHQTFDIQVDHPARNNDLHLSFEEYRSLQTTLVGLDGTQSSPFSFVADGADISIREAVLSAQVSITSRARTFWEGQKNVLTKGYARPEEGHEGFKVMHNGKAGLVNRYPNSMVTKLVMEKQYLYLFSQIGAHRFSWLLANTAIFVSITGKGSNGSCYIQLSGRALTEAQPEAPSVSVQPLITPEDNPSVERQLKRKRRKKSDYLPDTPIPSEVASRYSSKATSQLPKRGLSRFESVRSARSEGALMDGSAQAAKAGSRPSPKVSRKPSEISFVRSRIFYARSSRNAKGAVDIGLPAVHVLNRSASEKELNKGLPTPLSKLPRGKITTTKAHKATKSAPVKNRKGKRKVEDTREKAPDQTFLARRTRHLAKYVFPRQYNLHNVFTTSRDYKTTTHLFRDYTVRETEIRERGSKPTPKRLKPVLPILAKVIKRHDNFSYRYYLDRYCPSRLPKRRLTTTEKAEIVTDLAEAQTMPSTQNSSISRASTIARDDPDILSSRKPRYTKYAIESVGEVGHFVTMVLKSLLPQEVFGSAYNRGLVLRWVRRFVRLRRFETFSLHQIVQSFRLSDVEWNLPNTSTLQRPTADESKKRLELVLELLYWIIDSLVIPLIRGCFYVTESAAYRNRTLYFRQDDWAAISRPVLLHLRETIFEPLSRASAVNIMASRKLGYSHVRLLPKETGVRPIVNLRRRSTKQFHATQIEESFFKRGKPTRNPLALSAALGERLGNTTTSSGLGRSINQILQSTFHILTYEKNRLMAESKIANDGDQGMLSSAIFGQNDIYRHLKRFKQKIKLESAGKTKQQLYFVKVDVRCAFDSIDQGKLLEILEQILSHQGNNYDGYRIHRYAKVMAGKPAHATMSQRPSLKRKFASLAQPDSTHLDFCDLATSLATALHDIVFVDNVAYQYEDTSFVLALLRDHVTANLIKIGRDYYRQKVGIPQGSSLSTLLCNFFYADMEAHSPQMRFLRETDKKGLLLRYTDDFLFITSSKSQAKKFYRIMHQGHPTYGCFISPEKTLVNFDLLNREARATENPFVPRVSSTAFPWCGITISTRDLGVETDLVRYKDVDMRDTLTVDTHKRPGQVMVDKMLQSIKARCHVLFTDTALNGDARVYSSIYIGFVIAALKLVAYLGELRRFNIKFEAKYLCKAVNRLVMFTSRYIASRATIAKAKVKAENAQVRAAAEEKAQRIGTLKRKENRAQRWHVSCAVQAQFVHWLGYAAFLAVLSPKPRTRTIRCEAARIRRSAIDRGTHAELVTLLQDVVYKRSHARKRMLKFSQSALSTVREALDLHDL